MAVKIEKDTIIGDILDVAPQSAPLFFAIGMHCLGCPSSLSLIHISEPTRRS